MELLTKKKISRMLAAHDSGEKHLTEGERILALYAMEMWGRVNEFNKVFGEFSDLAETVDRYVKETKSNDDLLRFRRLQVRFLELELKRRNLLNIL